MKISLCHIFFLCSLFFTNVQAQTFEPLENTKYNETVFAIHELPNGHFIYLHTLRFPQNIEAVLATNDSSVTTVKIIDLEFNLVASYPIKSTSEDELFFGWDILLKDNSFLIFGNVISYNHPFRQGFTIELDQDLQPIDDINIFNQLNSNLTGLSLPQFNHQGNLVFWASGQGIPQMLFEVTEQGDYINSLELTLPLDNYVQLADSNYLLQYPFNDQFQTLSTDWDSLGEIHTYDDDLFTAFLGSPGTSVLLPNDQWLVSGVLRQQDSETQEFYRVENASVLQPDGSRFTVFENDDPDRPFWSTGIYGIAGLYEEAIFVSNAGTPDDGISPGCNSFSFNPDCENFVSLHSFNINGTTNWSQYLGFDASYFPIKMVATRDSGVVLLVYRFKIEDNPTGDEGDTYFLRFDKDGNIDFPVNVEELNGIRIQKVRVYPNPTSEVLRYEYQLSNVSQLTIQLFNTSGRLVLSDGLEDRETKIDQLAAGTYFYKISGDGEPLQSGKVIIE